MCETASVDQQTCMRVALSVRVSHMLLSVTASNSLTLPNLLLLSLRSVCALPKASRIGFVFSTFCSNSPTLDSKSRSDAMAVAAEDDTGDRVRALLVECAEWE